MSGALKRVRVDAQRLVVPGLRAPRRIAHVTDLHLPDARAATALAAVAALRPELVVLTGDYVGYGLAALPLITGFVASIEAPCIAVLGNHDHWAGADAIADALRAGGALVLRNEAVDIDGLHLVGLDDAVTGHDDLDRATARVTGPTLALSHDPRASPALWARGVHTVLSGHTHGGHIDLGALTDRLLGHRFIGGRIVEEAGTVYVCAGLGGAVMPWRAGRRSVSAVGAIELVGG